MKTHRRGNSLDLVRSPAVWIAMAMALSSCAKTLNATAQFDDPPQKKQDDPPTYQRAQCELVYSDYTLDIDLASFEFYQNTEFKFGFHPNGSPIAIDLGLRITSAKLFMDAHAAEGLEDGYGFDAKANSTELHINVGGGYSGINGGFEYYKKTPVYKMAHAGLMNVIENFKKEILPRATHQDWSTRIESAPPMGEVINPHTGEKSDGTHIWIQAGADADIQVGDEFDIYPITHHWQGEPCHSGYKGYTPDTMTPLVRARVEASSPPSRRFTRLKIISGGLQMTNKDLLQGDLVVQSPPSKGKKLRPLARSIRINSITSGDLLVNAGNNVVSKVDLPLFMRKQIEDVILDKKWKDQFYLTQP
ncbi:MAG: hypothetical protein COT73_01270 [Bdellovibrio sp. CG10_big_fil_rev_8_21_14_0_10_47_8]|nr:MAG: hypothetical protein COT73_01270 [Bdellovibrio sp. CG10_big_fil_rev_8_21_14_0_10_47_8]